MKRLSNGMELTMGETCLQMTIGIALRLMMKFTAEIFL